jgi:hypothetical protein
LFAYLHGLHMPEPTVRRLAKAVAAALISAEKPDDETPPK